MPNPLTFDALPMDLIRSRRFPSRAALGHGLVGVGSLSLSATACGGDWTNASDAGAGGSPAGTAGTSGSVGGSPTGGSGAASGAGGGGGSSATGGAPGVPMDASGWRNVRVGGGGYVTGLL